ncbi:hypothetical protein X975_22344, partial [Stegodyphus mimosarum]
MEGVFNKPLITGKKLRCFKNINPKVYQSISIKIKSWMMQCIISEWLIAFSETISKK